MLLSSLDSRQGAKTAGSTVAYVASVALHDSHVVAGYSIRTPYLSNGYYSCRVSHVEFDSVF